MTNAIESAIFRIASLLEVPVLVLALVAVALVLVESGRFLAEATRRRARHGRGGRLVEGAAIDARDHLQAGDPDSAARALAVVATGSVMRHALIRIVAAASGETAPERVAKVLADFDYASLRRLERTRLLVRFGPALGLMGTLIPLSPALSALAGGDVKQLASNLRIAFSVTVLGILVGAVSFAISLVRDRYYGQDLSDLQYVAALLTAEEGS